MKHSLLPIISITIAAFCAHAVLARTPAQVKTDLADIMPSGKKARIVWAQGTPSSYGSNNAQVWGIDSDDGVARQITTGSINADWPCLTGDGSRVIFWDMKASAVKIVNFSGGTIRTLNADHVGADEVSIESYVDPTDKSDWVIIGKACGGQVGRINIDDPTKCVKLWTCGMPCPSYGDGIALSLDGTRLAAMWQQNCSGCDTYTSGVGTIQGSTVKQNKTWIGCGVSMLPDNSYRVSFADKEIRMYTGTLPYTTIPAVSKTIAWIGTNNQQSSGCQEWFEYANHRWTNDADFLTLSMYSSKANPFLYKVSSQALVALQDNLGCVWTGHSDVNFFSSTGVKREIVRGLTTIGNGLTLTSAVYSINGRRLDPARLHKDATHLVIRRMEGASTASLSTVVTAQ